VLVELVETHRVQVLVLRQWFLL
jgi:hypothetical protein